MVDAKNMLTLLCVSCNNCTFATKAISVLQDNNSEDQPLCLSGKRADRCHAAFGFSPRSILCPGDSSELDLMHLGLR